jgi:nitrate/TMAO reductase-like tetraheme cytochrome c subunit
MENQPKMPKKLTPQEEVALQEEGEYIPPSGSHGKRGGNNMNWKSVAMNAVVAIIVVVVMSMMGVTNWVTKDSFKTNWDTIQSAMVKVQTDADASVNSIKQTVVGVQNTMNTLPSTITSQVNTAITQATTAVNSQITSIQSQVNNMASTVKSASDKADGAINTINTLNTKVEAYKTQQATDEATITADKATIVDLTTRVKALETKVVTPTPTSSTGITAKIKSTSNVLSASGNTTLIGSFRVTLTNTTAADVSDIILEITSQTDYIGGNHYATLSGGGTSWQRQGSDPTYADFINGTWGLNVAANTTVTLYLTLTITETTVVGNVGYTDYMTAYGSNSIGYTTSVSVQ